MNTLVIGVGQALRGDDGAGLEIVRTWKKQFPRTANQVTIEFYDEPGLSLIDQLSGMKNVVLVDTLKTTEKPGTVVLLDTEALFGIDTEDNSTHGWGVIETLRMGRALNILPATCRVRVIGIAGKNFEIGTGYCEEVCASLEKAIGILEVEVKNALK